MVSFYTVVSVITDHECQYICAGLADSSLPNWAVAATPPGLAVIAFTIAWSGAAEPLVIVGLVSAPLALDTSISTTLPAIPAAAEFPPAGDLNTILTLFVPS